jgi:hypothetical protein
LHETLPVLGHALPVLDLALPVLGHDLPVLDLALPVLTLCRRRACNPVVDRLLATVELLEQGGTQLFALLLRLFGCKGDAEQRNVCQSIDSNKPHVLHRWTHSLFS